MTSTIELPVWFAVAVTILAVIALLDRLLLPSLRWALRRRANRAIDELNKRLKLRIQPFKATRRRELIDRLVYDAEVVAAAEAHAEENDIPREIAIKQARRYAAEIVPSFSAYAYFRVGTALARRVSQFLYRVRLGYRNDDALRSVDPKAAVVFVINHRSNMDYVLVTYVAASTSALSYAVGEWAQIFGLKHIIRTMGAYFIRRNSRNALYRRVLARYVAMATAAGVTQAVFPEGGLSRDGKLRPAKLGLLAYMTADFDADTSRDIVFIPVGLNYDRVLEDRVLTSQENAGPGGRAKYRASAGSVAKFVFHNIWLLLRGRWNRFGYTCVSFGEPVSLKARLNVRGTRFNSLSDADREVVIAELGEDLMRAIGKIIPALPVSLVATALRGAPDAGLTLFELKGHVFQLMDRIRAGGGHIHIPRDDHDYAIEVGLRALVRRRIVQVAADRYTINPGEEALAAYYANAIEHLVTQQQTDPTALPASRKDGDRENAATGN